MTARTVSHYRIIAKLGAGGMGEVYAAEDPRLGRKVALKFLSSSTSGDQDRVRRFIREAKAASALNHPNIITIYDIGESDEGRFIAMEMVEGRTLRSLMAEPVDFESIARIGSQIARALAVAHEAGIIHRDMKPENVMVRDDGYVKVLDFGLARLSDERVADHTDALTESGIVMGTAAYLSPEQACSQPVTSAADVFALGIVLYEAFTRQHPFRAGTAIGMVHSIVNEHPVAPSRLRPEIPASLDTLILGMLEKDPRCRPNCAEVELALDGLTAQNAVLEGATAMLPAQRLPVAAERRARGLTVGRDSQLAEFRRGFELAGSARGLMLCVSGEPGIGKTTVVEDFLSELASSGQACTIARGRCSERLAGAEAYLPFLEALDGLSRRAGSDGAGRIMKAVAPTWYVQVAPPDSEASAARLLDDIKTASQERMKREMIALLEELSRVRPLVLFFDDLHWADVSTVDLLAYVGTKLQEMRVLIIAAYRSAELLLNKHPFLQVKLELQARGVCHELPLEFLSRSDLERYLALEFPDHRFPSDFSALIHAKTEGNPLFVVDLTRYLRDREVIVQSDGHWSLAQQVVEIEGKLPESVRSMVQRKIDQLGDDERKLLIAASVQGYEFDSSVLAKALSMDPADVEDKLEVLDRVHGFVRMVEEREYPDRVLTVRYRFVHMLYQNALFGSLRPTRRASLSASVADALVGYYGTRSSEVASELAFLFETARDPVRASEYFQLAAGSAGRVFANREASQLARRGLAQLLTLPDTPERAQKELAAQMTLGVSLMSIQGFAAPEVERAYGRARELCQQLGESIHLFSVLYGLWSVDVNRAEYDKALGLAEQLMRLARGAGDADLVLQTHYSLGVTLDYLGDYQGAGNHYDEVLAEYDPARHRSLAYRFGVDPGVIAVSRLSWIRWVLGYPDQAKLLKERSLAMSTNRAHPLSEACALITVATLWLEDGEPARARKLSEEIITLSEEHGLAVTRGWGGVVHGHAVVVEGQDHAAGIAEIQGSLAMLRAIGTEMARTGFLFWLADALAHVGQLDRGLEALAEADEMHDRTGEGYYESEIHRLKGELLLMHAAGGQANAGHEAEMCFQRAIEIAARKGARLHELRAVISLSRLWQKIGKPEQAREKLAVIYGWFTEGFEDPSLKEAKSLLDELH